VALGDSTGIGLGARQGAGYVERLFARMEQKRSNSVLLNLSTAGATTADALNKQLPRLDGTGATLVTICLGLNDLLRGREAGDFAENYDALVTRVKQPGRLIVLTNLPDVASAPALKEMDEESLRLRLGQFNKAIEEIAGRHGTPLVDLYQVSVESAGARPEFFSSDGLHPSELAYARWAEAMWTVMAPAIHE
jgi:lysophospholipase L1-like esterase